MVFTNTSLEDSLWPSGDGSLGSPLDLLRYPTSGGGDLVPPLLLMVAGPLCPAGEQSLSERFCLPSPLARGSRSLLGLWSSMPIGISGFPASLAISLGFRSQTKKTQSTHHHVISWVPQSQLVCLSPPSNSSYVCLFITSRAFLYV